MTGNLAYERLHANLPSMGLSTTERNLDGALELGTMDERSLTEILDVLVQEEVKARQTTLTGPAFGWRGSLRKTLDGFDYKAQPSVDRKTLEPMREFSVGGKRIACGPSPSRPEYNIVCMAVNFQGNTSLRKTNRLHEPIDPVPSHEPGPLWNDERGTPHSELEKVVYRMPRAPCSGGSGSGRRSGTGSRRSMCLGRSAGTQGPPTPVGTPRAGSPTYRS